jgi:hypothetical protein
MFRVAATIGALVFVYISVGPSRAQEASKARAATAQEIRNRLAKPITLDRGIDANTSLGDAMAFLSERFGVSIIVNNSAFKDEAGVESADDLAVRLPRIVDVKLGTVLRLLAKQINGTYLIRGDHIEITTPQRNSPLMWVDPQFNEHDRRRHVPIVDAEFIHRPLNTALRELSDESGISIVLDARTAETAKTAVTATLNGVPIDTAVELLANMVGLKMVVKDRALYVTDPDNAVVMEAAKKAAE